MTREGRAAPMVTIARWMDFSRVATLDLATGRATLGRIPLRELVREVRRQVDGTGHSLTSGLASGSFDRLGGHLIASFEERAGATLVQPGPHAHVWVDGVVHDGRDVEVRVAGPVGRLGLTRRRLTVSVRGTPVLRTTYVPGRLLARLPGVDEWGTGGDDFDFGEQLAHWYGSRDGGVAT